MCRKIEVVVVNEKPCAYIFIRSNVLVGSDYFLTFFFKGLAYFEDFSKVPEVNLFFFLFFVPLLLSGFSFVPYKMLTVPF